MWPMEKITNIFKYHHMRDPFQGNKVSWHPSYNPTSGVGHAPEQNWMYMNDMDCSQAANGNGVLFTDELIYEPNSRQSTVEENGVLMGNWRVNSVKKGSLCFMNVKGLEFNSCMIVVVQKFMTVIYGSSITKELVVVMNTQSGSFLVVRMPVRTRVNRRAYIHTMREPFVHRIGSGATWLTTPRCRTSRLGLQRSDL